MDEAYKGRPLEGLSLEEALTELHKEAAAYDDNEATSSDSSPG